MMDDEFLCKNCKKKWKNTDKKVVICCCECYSSDIINLTKQERISKSKEDIEGKNRERKIELELLKRKLRRKAKKARALKNRYSRSKKR